MSLAIAYIARKAVAESFADEEDEEKEESPRRRIAMNIPAGRTCRRRFYDGYTFPVKRSHGGRRQTTNHATRSCGA